MRLNLMKIKKKLSTIIEEINQVTDSNFNKDIAGK